MTSEESIKLNGYNISDGNMYIKMYKCSKIFYKVLDHINTDSYTWLMYTMLAHYVNPWSIVFKVGKSPEYSTESTELYLINNKY
jgi:hypothetical protein